MESTPKLLFGKKTPPKWHKREYFYSGLPWWFGGKESVCQCSRHRFNPWSGKIPHTMGQLSPCATATEAHMPYGLCSMEATTMRSLSTATREQSPFAASREKLTRNEDSTQPKKKENTSTLFVLLHTQQSWEALNYRIGTPVWSKIRKGIVISSVKF